MFVMSWGGYNYGLFLKHRASSIMGTYYFKTGFGISKRAHTDKGKILCKARIRGWWSVFAMYLLEYNGRSQDATYVALVVGIYCATGREW